MSKAFDTVPHDLLLLKLSKFLGRSTLSWISSYLTQRSFSVEYGSYRSTVRNVTSGVPQGSLIGPLLFIFYLADLEPSSFNLMVKYADDLTAVIRVPKNGSWQSEFSNIESFCSQNKLKLNTAKSKQIVFN